MKIRKGLRFTIIDTSGYYEVTRLEKTHLYIEWVPKVGKRIPQGSSYSIHSFEDDFKRKRWTLIPSNEVEEQFNKWLVSEL